MRNLSNAAKHAIFSQQTEEAFIILVTISHSSFTDDIRVASDPFQLLPEASVRGVVSRGNEFLYFPFSITLPNSDDTGIARANVSFDNIDRSMITSIRRADSSLSIKIEMVLASDVNNVEFAIDGFKLDRVTYDALTISGEISMEYYDLEPFPSKRFTPSDFPGLF